MQWLRGNQLDLFIDVFDSLSSTPGFVSSELASFVSQTFVFLESLFGVDLLLTVCALVSVGVGFERPPENPPALQWVGIG